MLAGGICPPCKISLGKPPKVSMSKTLQSNPIRLISPLQQLGAAALYLSFAQFAILFTIDGIVWVASGLAMAILLMGGRRFALGLLLGALLANWVLMPEAAEMHWATPVVCCSGEILGVLVGAWLITRDGKFDLSLLSLRDYLRLTLLAGGIASLVAVLAETMMHRSDAAAGAMIFASLPSRWMGDFLGILLVAPLILIWRQPIRSLFAQRRKTEFFLVLAALLFAGFNDHAGFVIRIIWMFILLSWAVVRLGTSGTVIISGGIAALALIGGSSEAGFNANHPSFDSLNAFQLFIAFLSVSGMSLAYLFERQVKPESGLIESDTRLQAIIGNVPAVTFRARCAENGRDFVFSYVSNWSANLFGVESDELIKAPDLFRLSLHEGEKASFDVSLEHSASKLVFWNWEGRIVFSGCGEKWINLRAMPRRCGDGAVEFDGVMFNITRNKRVESELEESRKNLRKLAALDAMAREEERKHIAREVHDELGQILTALRINISLLRIQFGGSNPQLMEKLPGIIRLVDRALCGVRNVSTDLRPAALDMGLISALKWLSKEFSEHTAIPCVMEIEGRDIDVGEELAVGIFRIVQESLTNVARHAETDSVRISMERLDGKLSVKVSDFGKGFDPLSRGAGESFGLMGMRERAYALGGDFNISSAPGRGTTVSVCIPIRQEEGVP